MTPQLKPHVNMGPGPQNWLPGAWTVSMSSSVAWEHPRGLLPGGWPVRGTARTGWGVRLAGAEPPCGGAHPRRWRPGVSVRVAVTGSHVPPPRVARSGCIPSGSVAAGLTHAGSADVHLAAG